MAEEQAKSGVSGHITQPQQGGRSHLWQPGQSGNPAGRKPRETERAYLDALRRALPPEAIEQLITEALDTARKQNSWRGMAEVLQLALAYGAGKPVNRVQTSDGNLAALLDALGQGQPAAQPAAGGAGEQQQAGTAGELTDDERGGE